MKGKLSARRLRALQAAEHVAMAFRATLAAPAWAPNEESSRLALDWCIRWMELTGKHKYELPPPVPARWKRNRQKAMGLEE